MREVRAVEVGQVPSAGVLDALAQALAGRGPLLVPHAPGAAPELPEATGLDGAVAVGTSGSTGAPKLAALSAAALAASAAGTHKVLGGPGRWLLALPAHHVAGLQVVLRGLAAGHAPVAIEPGHFDAGVFVRGCARLTGGRRYASLVPTQLRRILADPAATAALAGLDGVLVGGAATPPDLLAAARATGARVHTTYGMSETAGGCVYDGAPLPGVRVRTLADDGGRIVLGGPTLAEGYLAAPGERQAAGFVSRPDGRWFVTGDVGEWRDGRLRVLGRADDVIVTGGLKVAPGVVEDAVREVVPPGTDVVALPVPDPEWGQVVGLVLAGGTDADSAHLSDLRERLRGRLAPEALPRRLAVVAALPLLGIGKPDRPALARLLAENGRT